MQRVVILKFWFYWKSNFGPRKPEARSQHLFHGVPVGYVYKSREFSSSNSILQHNSNLTK